MKVTGKREPFQYTRQQLLQKLTPAQYADAEAKHLQAVLLQETKLRDIAEREFAVLIYNQLVMDLMTPEAEINAALELLHDDDGIVTQAIQVNNPHLT